MRRRQQLKKMGSLATDHSLAEAKPSSPGRGRWVAWATIAHAAILVRDTLLEIFDESAYARYLKRNSFVNSPDAYRQFMRETAGATEPKARCC